MNPANSAQALSNLQAVQAQSQDPNAILANQRQQLGVTGAQDTVTGLRGAINNTTKLLKQVAPSVMGRTAGSLVTNAQATRQIGNEQAPISQRLGEQTNDYNQSNQDLDRLQQEAQQAASGIYQGQQDKLSYAQNLYNSLYQQEKDAADRAEQTRQYNADLAEKKREADLASRASSGGGISDVLSSLLNKGGNGLGQGMSYKNNTNASAGVNFNFGGTPVSAAKYAQINGGDLRNLLYNMGSQGDKTAAAALQDLTKSGGKWTPQIQKKYPSLFWGI